MDIRKYLENSPLLFDGAVGTYYAEKQEKPLEKCELANVLDPEAIFSIHQEYIAAGCKALKTNTFQANSASIGDPKLAKLALTKGYEIACRAALDSEIFIFADIGPIPRNEQEDLLPEYQQMVDLFLSLGAKHFLFETFSSGEDLHEISAYIKSKRADSFILLEFAVSPEGYTRQGMSGEQLFEEFAQDVNIDALGFNCMSGPFHLLHYIKKIKLPQKIVSVMPNASYPTVINNRTFFANNAEYFSEQMMEIIEQGVKIIGGCCGTTPDFIAHTAEKLLHKSKDKVIKRKSSSLNIVTRTNDQYSFLPNVFVDKIAQKEKLIAVELAPPIDTNIKAFMMGAEQLKLAGADAITIADCPIARARVDSSILACKIKRELAIETLPHMTCRDRNINATKALLLGLNIEGVKNVLVITGDPIPTAERSEIKSVYNFNSIMLAGYINNLNKEGVFGNPFHICAALNVNAINFELQLERAKQKIAHGVTMFLTQPVLTKIALENLQLARKTLDAKLLGGIMPIVSYKNACFMNNEISGIVVSDSLIKLYENITKERASELAVEISSAIAQEIASYVDGFYLITPFKRVDIICKIMQNIKSEVKEGNGAILENW
ncbi:MAG: bifunctional homocysteine S-methyltransferase/methylenetetrahydrofolate reductase [Clostridia bacterium]